MAAQIHNRKMQDLWARILASEIANPDNFSLRSLSILKQLTHREAQILGKTLGMAIKVNKKNRLKLISGYRISDGLSQIFRKSPRLIWPYHNLVFPIPIFSLWSMSVLLHRSEFETGLLSTKDPITLTMMDHKLTLLPKSEHLLFSYYSLTPIGDELAQRILPKFDGEYLRSIKVLFAQDFKIR
jgi:uncharacterized repeat protein (TIGR03899 family)